VRVLQRARRAFLRIGITFVSLAILVDPAAIHAAEPADKPDNSANKRKDPFREVEAELPVFPQEGSLVEFQVSGYGKSRFYVDPAALSLGPDRVIRFTVVARSPSGVKNVSFEGIRCETGEYKVYAFGTSGGTWSPATGSVWRSIRTEQRNFRTALENEFFCRMKAVAGASEKDILDTLRGAPISRFVGGSVR
jgi:hypothetical protein